MYACEYVCGRIESSAPRRSVSARPQRLGSTCSDSMWSSGPAHRSQTLLLLFTVLAGQQKTAAGPHAVLSAGALTTRKHVLQRKFSEKTVL